MGVLKRGLNGIFSRICTRVLSISMGRVKAWGGTGQAVLPLGGVRSLIYTHKLHANVTTGHLLFSYFLQSGASSLAKHRGAYFSAVYGSIQDPIAAPGLFDIQVP